MFQRFDETQFCHHLDLDSRFTIPTTHFGLRLEFYSAVVNYLNRRTFLCIIKLIYLLLNSLSIHIYTQREVFVFRSQIEQIDFETTLTGNENYNSALSVTLL